MSTDLSPPDLSSTAACSHALLRRRLLELAASLESRAAAAANAPAIGRDGGMENWVEGVRLRAQRDGVLLSLERLDDFHEPCCS